MLKAHPGRSHNTKHKYKRKGWYDAGSSMPTYYSQLETNITVVLHHQKIFLKVVKWKSFLESAVSKRFITKINRMKLHQILRNILNTLQDQSND